MASLRSQRVVDYTPETIVERSKPIFIVKISRNPHIIAHLASFSKVSPQIKRRGEVNFSCGLVSLLLHPCL